jgi:hypothetical protein
MFSHAVSRLGFVLVIDKSTNISDLVFPWGIFLFLASKHGVFLFNLFLTILQATVWSWQLIVFFFL